MENIPLAEPGVQLSIWALFLQAGWVVKLVMIGLLVRLDLDLGDRRRQARRLCAACAARSTASSRSSGRDSRWRSSTARWPTARPPAWARSSSPPCASGRNRFEKGAKSPLGLQTRIDKAMDLALTREMERLEGRLGFLATIGSAAPFIGLFGTVVGIMTSFQAIAGSKSTNLAVVAPGIAEALLATAIGLLAAIPAVIAYNKLSSDAGKIAVRMEGFADEFSAILSRQIDEKVAPRRPEE